MKIKAVILAAGFGGRMGEYTKTIPKPMLPLAGKPLIEYTIRQLTSFGIKDIGLNLHFQPDVIKNYFGDGSAFGAHLNYVYEKAPTGTAGGVKSLESFLKDAEHFLVIYGDIICDLDYSKLIAAHLATKAMATVCVHERKKSNSIVEFDQKMKVQNFIERPTEEVLSKYPNGMWVNSAIYCFKREILTRIPSGQASDFPRDIFPKLVSEGDLYAYKLSNFRYAIDSEEKYLDAQKNFSKFRFNL